MFGGLVQLRGGGQTVFCMGFFGPTVIVFYYCLDLTWPELDLSQIFWVGGGDLNPWLTDKKPALYHQATVADLETDSQKLNSIQISARMLLKKSKASIAFFKAMLALNNEKTQNRTNFIQF